MPKDLTPAERQVLKRRAHGLNPVVRIGVDGLTPAVLAEVERALKAHELVKIRAAAGDDELREHFLEELCTATGASRVQHIGRMLVVHRERPVEEKLAAPPSKPARRREPGRSKRPSRDAPRRAKLRSR
jgi:RNA-binding protein